MVSSSVCVRYNRPNEVTDRNSPSNLLVKSVGWAPGSQVNGCLIDAKMSRSSTDSIYLFITAKKYMMLRQDDLLPYPDSDPIASP